MSTDDAVTHPTIPPGPPQDPRQLVERIAGKGAATGELPQQEALLKLARDQLTESATYLHSSSLAIRRAYWTVFSMYCSLFVVGLLTAIAAIWRGFQAQNPAETIPALLFAGLSVGSFFTLFIIRPLESLERNSIYSSWLIAAVNTYWTQLLIATSGSDLKNATNDLVDELTKLADKHDKATGKYSAPTGPGGDTTPPKTGSNTHSVSSSASGGSGSDSTPSRTEEGPPRTESSSSRG
jgi:hypothetical protein